MNTAKDCCGPGNMTFFHNNTRGDFHQASSIAIVVCFFNVVLAISATLGNGMIIIIILRSQSLQTPSYILITSLAFTDLLVGLLEHPLIIVINIFVFIKRNYQWMYKLITVFDLLEILLISLSVIMSMYISIDRYLALHLKHRYRSFVTRKRVLWLVLLVWILALPFSLTTTYIRGINWAVHITLAVFGLIALLVTCTFYIKSFITLHRYTAQVQAQQPNPSQGNFDVVKYRKSLKTMVGILGCLLVCYSPVLTSFLVYPQLKSAFGKDFVIFKTGFASTIFALNSSINPIIYLMRFSDIRQACRQRLQNRLQNHHHPVS